MKKDKSVRFKNNDIYFMEILDSFIIINYNYKGIIVLDENLNIIDKIVVFEGMLIYDSFKARNKILLYCLENDCFIYFNVITREIRKINIAQKHNVFSKLYEWDGNNVILQDYYNNNIKVNLLKMEICEHDFNKNEDLLIKKLIVY